MVSWRRERLCINSLFSVRVSGRTPSLTDLESLFSALMAEVEYASLLNIVIHGDSFMNSDIQLCLTKSTTLLFSQNHNKTPSIFIFVNWLSALLFCIKRTWISSPLSVYLIFCREIDHCVSIIKELLSCNFTMRFNKI